MAGEGVSTSFYFFNSTFEIKFALFQSVSFFSIFCASWCLQPVNCRQARDGLVAIVSRRIKVTVVIREWLRQQL